MTTLTIDNYKDYLNPLLEKGWPFQDKCICIFPVSNGLEEVLLKYQNRDYYLNNLTGFNDEIFDLLEIDPEDFCEKSYGYRPLEGMFPECRNRKDLVRVTYDLFEECVRRRIKVKTIKLTNIEIDL